MRILAPMGAIFLIALLHQLTTPPAPAAALGAKTASEDVSDTTKEKKCKASPERLNPGERMKKLAGAIAQLPDRLPIRHPRATVGSTIIGGLTLAALRVGIPRMRNRLRRKKLGKKKLGSQETFAELLNLTSNQFSMAVYSGRLFDAMASEFEVNGPIIEESLQTSLWKISNWSDKIPQMGPATTAIATAYATLGEFWFRKDVFSSRCPQICDALDNMVNNGRRLNLSGLSTDARGASNNIEEARKTIDMAVDNFMGMSIHNEISKFFDEVQSKMQSGKNEATRAEIMEQVVAYKVSAIARIRVALELMGTLKDMFALLRQHTELKDKWTLDNAAVFSPIETRSYSKSYLGDAAEEIACVRRSIMEHEDIGPRWFPAGMAILERINYYEGLCWQRMGDATRSLVGLSMAINYMVAQESNNRNLLTWKADVEQTMQVMTAATKQIQDISFSDHKRLVCSMQCVLSNDTDWTNERMRERVSWYQEAASQRIVTVDEDVEVMFDAMDDLTKNWPTAQAELAKFRQR